ncbi:MAG TPA: RNA polymerase subunit sigma, partial [bacterium]|nr:RNA polymerase subunit sigma [bacterium]
MKNETTHPSLLQRVQDASDQEAWSLFEARYRELILRYCRRKGMSSFEAEDVRQMVMLGLVQA